MVIHEHVAIADMRIYRWLCSRKMQNQIAFFEGSSLTQCFLWGPELFNAFFEGASDSMQKVDIYFPGWTDTGQPDFRIEKFISKLFNIEP